MRIPSSVQEFSGDDEFVGENPPSGARIVYHLRRRHLFGDMLVEIVDAGGEVITTLPGGKRKGVNVVTWATRKPGPTVPPAASLVPQMFSLLGPQVAEGTYTVRIVKGDQTYPHEVKLEHDPRAAYTVEDRAVQDRLVVRLYDMLARLTYVVDAVSDLRSQALERAGGLEPADAVAKALRGFAAELETFRKTLVATREGGFLAGEEQLREDLAGLYGSVNGYEGRPTQSQIDYTDVLETRLKEAEVRLDAMTLPRIGDLNVRLQSLKLPPLEPLSKAKWEKQRNR
jgi:hypothetical protein